IWGGFGSAQATLVVPPDLRLELEMSLRRDLPFPVRSDLRSRRNPRAGPARDVCQEAIQQLQSVSEAHVLRVQHHREEAAALVLRVEFPAPVARQHVGILETRAGDRKQAKVLVVEMVVVRQRQQYAASREIGHG